MGDRCSEKPYAGRGSNPAQIRRIGLEHRPRVEIFAPPRPIAVWPVRRLASPPLIRIARLIDPVGGINDVFGGTTQLDESVG